MLEKLLNYILQETKNKNLKWIEVKEFAQPERRLTYESTLVETKIKVSLWLDEKMVSFQSLDNLDIINNKLNKGRKTIINLFEKNTTEWDIAREVYIQYVEPNLKSRNKFSEDDIIFSNIIDENFKALNRDNAINEIMDELNIKENEVKSKVKKRLFGKWW